MTTMATTQRTTDEADIRQRIDNYVDAIRAMDLERVMAIFVPDLVSFDFEAPLRHLGAEAKRKNWATVFGMYQRPLGYEVRDLTIAVSGDVAFGHSLNRLSGTMKSGATNATWVRWTIGLRKIDGTWFIVHDQVSVPADPAKGTAFMKLEP